MEAFISIKIKKMIILNSATISKIQTLHDRSLKITLETPELPYDTMTDIFAAFSKSQSGIQIDDVDIPENKSKSSRLRAVLWQVWNNNTNKSKSFDLFYAETMEKIINKFKDKIPN